MFILSTVAIAGAQTPVDPSTTPVENTGGWVFSMAQLLTLLGVVTVLFLIVMYMRYAPRFAKDEEGLKVVRADRVRPGHALPRRDVDISQAAPVVVAPPAVPVAVGAPAPRRRTGRSRRSRSCRRRPAAARAAPAAAPAAEAGLRPPHRPRRGTRRPPPPAAAPAERVEVSIDQAVFDETLEELLAKGPTAASPRARPRRAAMIAARRKAGGG